MMDCILDALHEGRLIELPENDKEDSLRLLAHLLEAIPSVPAGTDVAGLVLERERSHQTGIGMGWACPHARIPSEGDLLCALGWSPEGIDYGPPGQPPVRLIAMYLVPDNQKNLYLKEVSAVVKALRTGAEFQHLETAKDLNTIRTRLLDLVTSAREAGVADARARMIQLEARLPPVPPVSPSVEGMVLEPVSIVAGPGNPPVILTQNRDLLSLLEASAGLTATLANGGRYDEAGWSVLRRSSTHYQGEKVVYECLAVRLAPRAVKVLSLR